jgi:hypothetical protein
MFIEFKVKLLAKLAPPRLATCRDCVKQPDASVYQRRAQGQGRAMNAVNRWTNALAAVMFPASRVG